MQREQFPQYIAHLAGSSHTRTSEQAMKPKSKKPNAIGSFAHLGLAWLLLPMSGLLAETTLIEPNDGRFGFGMGAMYSQGSALGGTYIDGAYVDINGRTRIRRQRDTVVATLPVVSLFATPWATDRCYGFWCDLSRIAMIGVTAGFGGGSSNNDDEESSSSLAMTGGISIGIAGKNFHMGLYYGIYNREGAFRKPAWLEDNTRYPFFEELLPELRQLRESFSREDREVLSTILTAGIDIPLPETTARYQLYGFIISIAF